MDIQKIQQYKSAVGLIAKEIKDDEGFAVQTRKAELIEERLNEIAHLDTRERLRASEKQLSRNIYQRGVKYRADSIN